MNQLPSWKYILLYIGIFFIILSTFICIGAYFHIPLPFVFTKTASIVSQTPIITKPIQRFTTTKNVKLYVITGKFVTNPTYNAQNVLQGDFVIDNDPTSHRIPVIMTSKTDTITVGRSQGNFDGKTVVGPENTENLRQSITINAPVQLRIYPITTKKTENDMMMQKVMDGLLAGTWSIPDDFVLLPSMVGIVE